MRRVTFQHDEHQSPANAERSRDADRPTSTHTVDRDDDAALLVRARNGDEYAWRSLVERHTPSLSFAASSFGLGATDVADVVQLTWLRCVEHADRIHAPERLRAWLMTTCRNECRRVIRLGKRNVLDDTTDAAGTLARLEDADPASDPQERILRAEARWRLKAAVADLPLRQGRVIRVLFFTDTRRHHYVDVSAALGLPVGSIGPTRQRALRVLRRDHRLAHLHPD